MGLRGISETKSDILGKTLTRGLKEEGSPGIWFHLGGEGLPKTFHVRPHGETEESVLLGMLCEGGPRRREFSTQEEECWPSQSALGIEEALRL
ncbi:hypothetical protein LIER_43454 [Lithospermum erythrorhizon]|uniref:Uncharacterized protein n=1 Tax=Lithospermum erythrorhizon TaxID=34254 RepID=A0AAV3Q4F1_LITER